MNDRMKEISEAAQKLWASRPVQAITLPPSLWDRILAVVKPEGEGNFEFTIEQFVEAHRQWVESGEAGKPYDGSWDPRTA